MLQIIEFYYIALHLHNIGVDYFSLENIYVLRRLHSMRHLSIIFNEY